MTLLELITLTKHVYLSIHILSLDHSHYGAYEQQNTLTFLRNWLTFWEICLLPSLLTGLNTKYETAA